MKRIIAITMIVVLAMPVVAKKVSPERHNENVKLIAEMKRIGFVKQINLESHEVVVDTSLWKMMTYEQKGGLVMTISEYFEYKTDLGHLVVRCNYTNKKIGSFGSWGGFKVYE